MYFEWGGVCEEIDAGWVAKNRLVVSSTMRSCVCERKVY